MSVLVKKVKYCIDNKLNVCYNYHLYVKQQLNKQKSIYLN